MDLIAFQLIAPHASTKLNQTEVPLTSLISNPILLDIIIRWYWLLMSQQFLKRWVSARLPSCHPMTGRTVGVICEFKLPSLGVFSLSICLWPSLAGNLLCTVAHWTMNYKTTQGIDAVSPQHNLQSCLLLCSHWRAVYLPHRCQRVHTWKLIKADQTWNMQRAPLMWGTVALLQNT